MNTSRIPAHYAIADLEAEDALIDITIASKAATERMNRSIGQITRRTMARIEIARRRYIISDETTKGLT